MKRVLLIYNPRSGKRRLLVPPVLKLVKALHKECDIDLRTITKNRDSYSIINSIYGNEYDLLIACGGDGTLHHVVNALLDSQLDIPIAYAPCGSTNDFAKTLNLPKDPYATAKSVLKSEPAPIDLGAFNEETYFTYVASFGLLPEVSYKVSEKNKNRFGYLAYLMSGLKALIKIGKAPTYKIDMTIDNNRRIEGEYLMGLMCNSVSVGGLIKLPSDIVDIQDGKFEGVFFKKPASKKEWVSLVKDVLRGNFMESPLIDFFEFSQLSLSMPKTLWSLDGERAEGSKNVSICCIPYAVKIHTKHKNFVHT